MIRVLWLRSCSGRMSFPRTSNSEQSEPLGIEQFADFLLVGMVVKLGELGKFGRHDFGTERDYCFGVFAG
jgi:hypothetical protein